MARCSKRLTTVSLLNLLLASLAINRVNNFHYLHQPACRKVRIFVLGIGQSFRLPPHISLDQGFIAVGPQEVGVQGMPEGVRCNLLAIACVFIHMVHPFPLPALFCCWAVELAGNNLFHKPGLNQGVVKVILPPGVAGPGDRFPR